MTIPMPTSKLGQREAYALLEPHFSELSVIVRGAWTEVNRGCTDLLHRLRPETLAGMVNDVMKARAKEVFAPYSHLAPDDSGDFFFVRISGIAILRFKKLNDRGLPSNYQTESQRRYYTNLPLPGFESSLARLFVGYQLNDTQTAIARVLVTCPDGRGGNAWAFPVPDVGERNISRLPERPSGPRVGAKGGRVKPRDKAQES